MTVRNEMRVFALESIRGILDYVRKEYNLPEFAVKVRLDFSPRRRCSWGGRRDGENFISLALYKHYDNKLHNFPASFKEYASFASDPIIGCRGARLRRVTESNRHVRTTSSCCTGCPTAGVGGGSPEGRRPRPWQNLMA